MKVEKPTFDQALEELDVYDEFPKMDRTIPVSPFDGLRVFKAVHCLHCPKILPKASSMAKHHQMHHKDRLEPKNWPECDAQSLPEKTGLDSGFFQVILPNKVNNSTIAEMVAKLQGEMSGLLQVNVTAQNARNISPWLLTTRWHEHVEGQDRTELLQLVAIPKEDEFPGLKDLVLQYMKQATDLIGFTGELALQRLNTPDPAKT